MRTINSPLRDCHSEHAPMVGNVVEPEREYSPDQFFLLMLLWACPPPPPPPPPQLSEQEKFGLV